MSEINITHVLDKLLNILNISYKEMVDILNRSERQVRNYILNHEKPSRDVFNKIVDLINQNGLDIYKLFDIEDEGYLYHASEHGIKGKISTLVNIDDYNDFGNGFYLSDSLQNAITYVIDEDNPIIYRFHKDDVLKGNIYRFDDDKNRGEDNWVLYIGLNRGKMNDNDEMFFRQYFDQTFDHKDVLIGEIADSYNFEIMDSFFINQVDINQARQTLRFANIGLQYVLKNENRANELSWVDEYRIDSMLKEYLISLVRTKKDNLKKEYKEIFEKQTKDNALIFDRIKEKYKEKYGQD